MFECSYCGEDRSRPAECPARGDGECTAHGTVLVNGRRYPGSPCEALAWTARRGLGERVEVRP